MGNIILNKLDYLRIKKHIKNAELNHSIKSTEAESLMNELEKAIIVEPTEVPSDVVTMNSIVKISFPNTKNQVTFQIAYPDQANKKENKISIFSPIAQRHHQRRFSAFTA